MLKLYGWQDKFQEKLKQSRNSWQQTKSSIEFIDAVQYAMFNLIPSLAPAMTFALFMWFGETLDLAGTVAALSYFDRMIWSINWFPTFLTQNTELKIAFSRI